MVVRPSRVSIAIPSALVTKVAVGDASIDDPTTRREYVVQDVNLTARPAHDGRRGSRRHRWLDAVVREH